MHANEVPTDILARTLDYTRQGDRLLPTASTTGIAGGVTLTIGKYYRHNTSDPLHGQPRDMWDALVHLYGSELAAAQHVKTELRKTGWYD